MANSLSQTVVTDQRAAAEGGSTVVGAGGTLIQQAPTEITEGVLEFASENAEGSRSLAEYAIGGAFGLADRAADRAAASSADAVAAAFNQRQIETPTAGALLEQVTPLVLLLGALWILTGGR